MNNLIEIHFLVLIYNSVDHDIIIAWSLHMYHNNGPPFEMNLFHIPSINILKHQSFHFNTFRCMLQTSILISNLPHSFHESILHNDIQRTEIFDYHTLLKQPWRFLHYNIIHKGTKEFSSFQKNITQGHILFLHKYKGITIASSRIPKAQNM